MIKNESSLSRILQKYKESDCACISAFRGGFTKQENKSRSNKLLQMILHLGYSVTKIKGAYIEKTSDGKDLEVSEEQFFVQNPQNLDKNFFDNIKKLGIKFDQDSVLLIPMDQTAYLFGTNSTGYPGKGQKQIVGQISFGSVTQEYFSRVGGRAFEFKQLKESVDYQILTTETIFGKWQKSLLIKEINEELQKMVI